MGKKASFKHDLSYNDDDDDDDYDYDEDDHYYYDDFDDHCIKKEVSIMCHQVKTNQKRGVSESRKANNNDNNNTINKHNSSTVIASHPSSSLSFLTLTKSK
eukprot:7042101-Ditylum_brightwellii.AAC.1